MAFEKHGIDVSKWQGDIDFNAVKNSGKVDFAIIRDGYGWDNDTQKDVKFERNVEGFKSVGTPVGAYHFSYADSVHAAEREAYTCMKFISGHKFEMPIYYDVESEGVSRSLGKALISQMVDKFCSILEDHGYFAGIYANTDYFTNYLDRELLKKYTWWQADYRATPQLYNPAIFQYSSSGQIPGIAGNCDVNKMYEDLPSIITSKGFNGYAGGSTPAPTPTPEPAPAPSVTKYTVKSGDNLTRIAERFGTSVSAIVNANGISNPNLIYPGQVLTIPGSSGGSSGASYQTYTVKSGDSLWAIAQAKLGNGNRYKEIKSLNGLTSDTIYPGQTLKIPN